VEKVKRKFGSLKLKITLNILKKSNSHLTENTLGLRYKGQPVNAI